MNPDQEPDIWNRIEDPDKYVHIPDPPQSHDPNGSTVIALILVGLLFVGGAIGWFVYGALNEWLKLP